MFARRFRLRPCRIAIRVPRAPLYSDFVSLIYHTTRPTRRAVVASRYPTWCAAGASNYGRALSRLPQWTANALKTYSRSTVTSISLGILRCTVHLLLQPTSLILPSTSKWKSIPTPIGSPPNGPPSFVCHRNLAPICGATILMT
ncbi:hypothetical protein EVAR_52468_1 [Eumeta japonica]|uniref:Uncharacterized protein n=1 Tax=Eumeta variegata TaxID=151549 RepID=A0A4C1Z3X1_EUMVA|nr:hypothetical protein EVAR_52468_1 [Eumeta japonica]